MNLNNSITIPVSGESHIFTTAEPKPATAMPNPALETASFTGYEAEPGREAQKVMLAAEPSVDQITAQHLQTINESIQTLNALSSMISESSGPRAQQAQKAMNLDFDQRHFMQLLNTEHNKLQKFPNASGLEMFHRGLESSSDRHSSMNGSSLFELLEKMTTIPAAQRIVQVIESRNAEFAKRHLEVK